MNYEVQTKELRKESDEWKRRKLTLASAKGLADNGVGMGYNMGFFARLAHIDVEHDGFIDNMVKAFADGERTFDFIAAALDSAANNYDNSDATVVESMASLKRRLPDA